MSQEIREDVTMTSGDKTSISRLSDVTNLGSKDSKPRSVNITKYGTKNSKPRFGKSRAAVPKNENSEEKISTKALSGPMKSASPDIDVEAKKDDVKNQTDNKKEPGLDSLFADENEDDRGKVILRKRKLQTKESKDQHKRRAYERSAESRTHKDKRQEKRKKSKLNLDSVFENKDESSNKSTRITTSKIEGGKPAVEKVDGGQTLDDLKISEEIKLKFPLDGVASGDEIDEPLAERNVDYLQSPIPGQGGYPTKLDGRFLLAWNYYGKVWKSRASEVDMWSYEVEQSSQSNRFKHTLEFLQADIGPSGVVFGGGQRLKYVPQEFSRDEWEVDMVSPASVVAIGVEFVAVITEDCCLRILALSGIDSVVYRLPGSPIALSAAGALLAVIYSISNTLQVQLLNIQERKKLCELPLTFQIDVEHMGELQWAHLTGNGNLFVMDSKFRVQLLSKGFGWCWVPVLDLNVRQFVHPVWVEDRKTECLMTAGLSDGGCPDVRLPLEEVKLKFPITVNAAKKEEPFSGVLEMLLRKKLFFEQEPGKNIRRKKKVLEKFRLKAFSIAITSGLSEAKCMDIANSLELQVSEEFAAKLAFDSGMHSLSDSISAKSRKRLERKKQLERQLNQSVLGKGKEVNLGVVLATPSPSSRASPHKAQNSPARPVKRNLLGVSEKKKMFVLKTSRDGLTPAGANVIFGSGAKKVFRSNPFKKN